LLIQRADTRTIVIGVEQFQGSSLFIANELKFPGILAEVIEQPGEHRCGLLPESIGALRPQQAGDLLLELFPELAAFVREGGGFELHGRITSQWLGFQFAVIGGEIVELSEGSLANLPKAFGFVRREAKRGLQRWLGRAITGQWRKLVTLDLPIAGEARRVRGKAHLGHEPARHTNVRRVFIPKVKILGRADDGRIGGGWLRWRRLSKLTLQFRQLAFGADLIVLAGESFPPKRLELCLHAFVCLTRPVKRVPFITEREGRNGDTESDGLKFGESHKFRYRHGQAAQRRRRAGAKRGLCGQGAQTGGNRASRGLLQCKCGRGSPGNVKSPAAKAFGERVQRLGHPFLGGVFADAESGADLAHRLVGEETQKQCLAIGRAQLEKDFVEDGRDFGKERIIDFHSGAEFEGDLFTSPPALLGADLMLGKMNRGAIEPPGKGRMTRQPYGAAGESDEDVLRDLLREGGVPKLPESRAVNERQMTFDERGEVGLSAGGEIPLKQLGVRHITRHSILVFPQRSKSRKEFVGKSEKHLPPLSF